MLSLIRLGSSVDLDWPTVICCELVTVRCTEDWVLTSWRTLSCFLVERPRYRSWLAQNLAVCLSNFFFRSFTEPTWSLRNFSSGTMKLSYALSNILSLSSSIALISRPNSFKLPAMTSSSSVWLDPMQSKRKLIRWLARLRWALDRFFAVYWNAEYKQRVTTIMAKISCSASIIVICNQITFDEKLKANFHKRHFI